MKTAAEIMDRNFFYASPSDNIGVLLHQMAERGLGSVPVLDLAGRPLGVATTGEIEGCYDVEELIERLRCSAVCMDESTPVDLAARTLALHPSSSLVLVNGTGIAIGACRRSSCSGPNSGSTVIRPRCRTWIGTTTGTTRRSSSSAPLIAFPKRRASSCSARGSTPAPSASCGRSQPPTCASAWTRCCASPRMTLSSRRSSRHTLATIRFRCLTIYDAGQREKLASALCTVCEGDEAPPQPVEPEASPRVSGVMPKVEPVAALG